MEWCVLQIVSQGVRDGSKVYEADKHLFEGSSYLPDINITLHDGVEGGLVNAGRLHAHQVWLEEHLRAAEPLVTNGDHLCHGQQRQIAFPTVPYHSQQNIAV